MKKCTKCGQIKDESEYYKHGQTSTGLRPECKACSREYYIKYYAQHKADLIERSNRYRREHPERHVKSIKRYNNNNKEKRAAHVLLGHAVESGKIVKPCVCQICGTNSIIHGHHTDYSKPLDVVWVCPQCHKDIHRQEKENESL